MKLAQRPRPYRYNNRRLHCRFDFERYIELLSSVEPILDNIYGCSAFVFQQDNAPIHVSLKTREFFREHKWEVMDQPARSTDLNIIDNVWHMLSNIVHADKQYKTADEPWSSIQDAVESIMRERRDQLKNLYNDITQRLIKVVEAKGAIIER